MLQDPGFGSLLQLRKGKSVGGWAGLLGAGQLGRFNSIALMTHTVGLALASQWVADLSPHRWIWKTVNETQLLAGIILTWLTQLTVAT